MSNTQSHSPATDRGADAFARRHIGPSEADLAAMLATLGVPSVEALLDDTIPSPIRFDTPSEPSATPLLLDLPAARSEPDVLAALRELAAENRPRTSLIGMGYYGTHTPAVIQRNVLEDPAWYTAYTPYQPEISQGRLEALLNFQTMVTELTGLEVANASLLDEATAAAEAMTMARRLSRSASTRFVVDRDTHPQTLAVLATRAEPIGIDLVVGDVVAELCDGCFGVLLSLPTSTGAIVDWRAAIAAAHDIDAIAVVATDLLACTVLTPPGELGADIAIGSAQRFGVSMGFGGPHAAFIAAHAAAARAMPGRLVGVSADAAGRPALRLALQTREQHIRREKATSNICTAQVLLANIAGLYACWHGADGLVRIAARVNALTRRLATALASNGVRLRHATAFDTITADDVDADAVIASAADLGIDLRRVGPRSVGISLDETSTDDVADRVAKAFGAVVVGDGGEMATADIPEAMQRTSSFMSQSVFHRHRTEHGMLRYLRRLADRDLALDRTMIPLGSCTMKLNATTELASITWPEFADLHPFAPLDESVGTRRMIAELEHWLAEITGYAAVSVQPNAGSQGELAGLLAIRAFHRAGGDDQRTVCLIPSSAHGTNAASAVMAGFTVVVVATDAGGDIDLGDLRSKLSELGPRVGAIMVTYPSTHGIFEEHIADICSLVHDAGGQVYVDGANLNALVGLARPGRFGADVSHLNLHKTFCIPHGGGGPGVGPVAVRDHLVPFLPGDPLSEPGTQAVGPISAAPFGSAGILNIPWAYIALMGPDGLRHATAVAIASANYIAVRLGEHFPVLYHGARGRVGHECIVDLRPITKATGVTVDDVAKRLIDYGFHAPTMSFPVAGTLMIEPTESETLAELDRFCDAMIAIRREIDRVASGDWPLVDSPLRHAPHTAEDVIGEWDRPYPRQLGAYPVAALRADKYFPPVSRIDGAAGDRNLVCSCEPLEAYAASLADT
jgi:glycine cleavage system P protein (glycine dehydrogenase)